jgi:16S rRNA (guanine1516-N2)-methyltransferase
VFVDIDASIRRYPSLPAPKRGPLAQAIGRRTRSVIDATAGWGQDLGLLVAMGYRVTAVERSPVMGVLLEDGLSRLAASSDVRGRFELPRLVVADAVHYLSDLRQPPECVYLDPMFPPKRKRSALARRRLRLLREMVGDDEDRQRLFASALQTATKRVVVKRPDEARPIADHPDETYAGKLVRYDVYMHGYRSD